MLPLCILEFKLAGTHQSCSLALLTPRGKCLKYFQVKGLLL